MNTSARHPWVRAAVVLGVVYALVGVVFAAPAGHVRAWRLAAWAVCAAAYAAHIAYEHFGLRSSPRSGALHVALGVALGAGGLAAAANIRSLSAASTGRHRLLLLLALVIWPVMTAVPAFLAALAAQWLLARLPQRTRAR